MNEKIIEITDSNVHLSIDRGFMLVTVKDKSSNKIPLDDIGSVIANSYSMTYSNNLLAKLSELSIPLIVCGKNHNPIGMLLSLDSHYKQSEKLDYQIAMSEPMKKKIWQEIVVAKIKNQSVILDKFNKKSLPISSLICKVKSGDTANIEGTAAAYYFKELFGEKFRRDRELDGINSLLNYGYMIIRSAVARAVIAVGLNPSVALFHKNKLNSLRLVDDLMEPFRPLIDKKVYELSDSDINILTPELKRQLAETLFMDINFNQTKSPIVNRIYDLAYSYVAVIEKRKERLDVPIFSVDDL